MQPGNFTEVSESTLGFKRLGKAYSGVLKIWQKLMMGKAKFHGHISEHILHKEQERLKATLN